MAWLFCYNVEGGYMDELYKIIGKLYKEYQSYLNIKGLEDYVIEIKSAKEMGHTIASTMKKDGVRYLFLHEYLASNLLSGVAERWEIGVLFHEFTHIADDSIIEKSGVPKTKKYMYRLYVEYHAEFIKILYTFGIYPFSNNKLKLLHTEVINSQYGDISIYEYLINIKSGYVADIDIDPDDMTVYMKNYDLLSYYLGTASVYGICCNYNVDEIMDVTKFIDKLGDNARRIKDILLKSVKFGFDTKTAIECANIYIPMIQPFLNK